MSDLFRPQQVFSVSGPRGAGRTALYEGLESTLPERYPNHAFAFLGNPFGTLEHPQYWGTNRRDILASSRLLECWAQLNEFVGKKLRPALDAGKIVFTDGFGLDVYLHATAYCYTDANQCIETSALHHDLVTARLKRQNVEPPVYLLAFDEAGIIARRIHRSESEIASLLKHETDGIRHYFDRNGQKDPHILKGRDTGSRLEEALEILQRHL
ncbi:MAG: hypothetical protein ACYCZZ_00300 [Minisyncoccota bacterium]